VRYFNTVVGKTILLLLLLAEMSVASSPALLTTQDDIPADTVITFDNSSVCGGMEHCFTYHISIYADGTVAIQILSVPWAWTSDGPPPQVRKLQKDFNMNSSGVIKRTISLDTLKRLLSEFDRVQYFSLRDSYRSKEDGCPVMSYDNGTISTSLTMNGHHKHIIHSYNCHERNFGPTFPKELTELETTLFSVTGINELIDNVR
jgi:hypothetical protein